MRNICSSARLKSQNFLTLLHPFQTFDTADAHSNWALCLDFFELFLPFGLENRSDLEDNPKPWVVIRNRCGTRSA